MYSLVIHMQTRIENKGTELGLHLLAAVAAASIYKLDAIE